MGGEVSVRAGAAATAQGNATATARASATARGGSASAHASASATAGPIVKPMVITPRPRKMAATVRCYQKANSFLADPARPRGEKIALLKKLLKGDIHAQRVALNHLVRPEWIYYLKKHDNKIVRFIENLVTAELNGEQSIHVTAQDNMLWFSNQRQARLIWKRIKGEIRTLRMRVYIGDRCDFSDRQLKRLEKRGLERLYKSVTSFRPPRECRL